MNCARSTSWSVLIGSKKKLRQILTGEVPAEQPDEKLADDLLFGARAVANFTGLKTRQVYHQKDKLGLRALGASELRRFCQGTSVPDRTSVRA
jgi:hypothetical protein